MRGRFTPGAAADEWCERRLLARIHRYTIKRLRAEIEPVAARDFLRFLFNWQRVAPDARSRGRTRSTAIVAPARRLRRAGRRLGKRDPAGAARRTTSRPGSTTTALPDVSPGRGCGRATRGANDARPAPVRTTPITLLARRHAALWASLSLAEPIRRVRARAPRRSLDFITANGASFFDELVEGTRPAALPGRGGAGRAGGARARHAPTASPACARCWCRPAERRPIAGGGAAAAPRRSAWRTPAAGRWSRRPPRHRRSASSRPEAVEHVARALLLRYGVVFWRLLEREAAWLPPWRELLRVYRRLEARGEIRGGRFVAGFSGEQFALPEAIGMLRESAPQAARSDEWISVSGADPLNLAGILTPGPKLAALTGNRLLYRDGVPVATLSGGEMRFVETLDPATQWFARKALVRGTRRAPFIGSEAGNRRDTEQSDVEPASS